MLQFLKAGEVVFFVRRHRGDLGAKLLEHHIAGLDKHPKNNGSSFCMLEQKKIPFRLYAKPQNLFFLCMYNDNDHPQKNTWVLLQGPPKTATQTPPV